MRFLDREDAAHRIVRELKENDIDFDIVLAMPRGGVPLGHIISKEFGKPLDLVITRKIGAPMNPEYAIGAVTEDGISFWNEHMLGMLDREYVRRQVEMEQDEAKRRREKYLQGREHLPLDGKSVLIVDDGIATGLSIRAAVEKAKRDGAKTLIVAAPVGSPEIVEQLRNDADMVVVLQAPDDFQAVGEFYERFDQVSDEEVMRLMEGREELL